MSPSGLVKPSSRRHRVAWMALALACGLALALVLPALAQMPLRPVTGTYLVDGFDPPPDLGGSMKYASRSIVQVGDSLTYTILLRSRSRQSLVVQVRDPLPQAVAYVPDSAGAGGVYDPAERTLTWRDITLAPGASLPLNFTVVASATIQRAVMVVNQAEISSGPARLVREARILLLPGEPPQPHPRSDLSPSYKRASRRSLRAGEALTYTIRLNNAGVSQTLATVTDPLPVQVSYMEGSASPAAAYDPATRTLTWNDVAVEGRRGVDLTFAVRAQEIVSQPELVTNRATITAGEVALVREAAVMLMPAPPAPKPKLAGSFKQAWRRALGPGETLTYTIRLHNSGLGTATAQVMDPLPDELAYVDGSASDQGRYDPATHTLQWRDVAVRPGHGSRVSFAVRPAVTVSVPTSVTNTATISSSGVMIERSARVMLRPTGGSQDPTPPQVHGLVIGESDVLVDPQVTLHISATDNVEVKWMFLREWALKAAPLPHWTVVASSGWVTYQPEVSWKLQATSGVHYVGVWVADAARNRSPQSREAVDFASLTLTDAQVGAYGMVPYMVYYPAGTAVSAILAPSSGDADLYVWFPGRFDAPDLKSAQTGTVSETLSFTTTQAGLYLFLVYGGSQPTTYTLTLNPGGGPVAVSEIPAPHTALAPDLIQGDDGLSWEPVFSQSGLDPLTEDVSPDLPDSPGSTAQLYIPSVRR